MGEYIKRSMYGTIPAGAKNHERNRKIENTVNGGPDAMEPRITVWSMTPGALLRHAIGS